MTTKSLDKHLYRTRIDIPESKRAQTIELLNKSLAATLDLYTQMKQAHWNVKGPNFYQLHLLFDAVATEVFEYIDTLAERITALAGEARGTARMAAQASFLPEYPSLPITEKDHVVAVAERLAAYAKHVREALDKTDELDDQATNDIYTAIQRGVDQKLWFVEAHLQGEER
jgi:starvation-inducible DNA-binding protein